ncbi:hypothetical protein NMY22_g5716 [Coprinellus aureogranulatus]|nr:hypothetical protein NMY22_g5716 [Coprinellus aureogranulatus]
MMGVNRVLFELALEYKYEEVRFTSNDEATVRLFKQLRYANVAQLVKGLYLRPTFLPAMDDAFRGSELDDEDIATSFSWFRQLMRTPEVPRGTTSTANTDGTRVMTVARDVLPKCRNLREVTIIIYDHIIPDDLRDFLRYIWKTIGAGIQKLTLSTTLTKASDLFSIIARHSPDLPNLATIDLTVADSRFPPDRGTVDDGVDAIVGLVHRFNKSLSHFTFSSATGFDHAPMFKRLGTLPKLQTLEFWFVFCDQTISDKGESVSQFLMANRDTVEHIVLKTRPRFESFFVSSHPDKLHQWVVHQLAKLVLPHVKTLELGFRKLAWIPPDIPAPTTFPLLTHTFPHLRTLVILDVHLSGPELERVLDQTKGKLEGLECLVRTFSAEILAILASKCPRLTSLTLLYHSTDRTRDPHVCSDIPKMYRHIQAARYPNWPLSYLRIGQRLESCGQCHPNEYLAKLIKESVSRDVVVDGRVSCECFRYTPKHTYSSY